MSSPVSPQDAHSQAVISLQELELKGKQIRLLHLHSGSRDDPITCTLSTTDLDDNPRYEALSYAWGDPWIYRPIVLEGREVNVTANLAAALRRVRLPSEDRCLWVDALCINQANETEKSHQVNLMKEVYENTSGGVVWLGDFADEYTESEVKAQPGLYISRSRAERALEVIRTLAADEHLPSSPATEEGSKAFWDLTHLTWWNRMWTVQEVILPGTVKLLVGSIELQWLDLWKAVAHYLLHQRANCCEMTRRNKHLRSIYFAEALLQYFRQNRFRKNIAQCFLFFRRRMATDKRDKIFGLLGLLVDPDERKALMADYSVDWRQLYRDTIAKLIPIMDDLIPLIRRREQVRDPLLPSWVPDFSDGDVRDLAATMEVVAYPYLTFNACNGTTPVLDPESAPLELKLQGIELDTIERTGSLITIERIEDCPEARRGVEEWQKMLGDLDRPYLTGETYGDAFWRLFAFDHIEVVMDDPNKKKQTKADRQNQNEKQQQNKDRLDSTDGNEAPLLAALANSMFFITKKGAIGRGVAETQVGDVAFVLYGGKVPFVLRRDLERPTEDVYKYIGHAYIHGIMDGEALNADHEYDLEEKWITLI